MKGRLNYRIKEIKDGRGTIQMTYSYGRGTEAVIVTGKKINNVANWNSGRQRVKNIASETNSSAVNHWLNKKFVEVENALNQLEFSKESITSNEVKATMKKALGRANKEDIAIAVADKPTITLKSCYEWYIEYFSKNPTPTTKQPLAKSSLKSLNSCKKKFFSYCEKTGDVDFQDIDMDFYEKFVGWLHSKNYSNNYIGSHIKNLKTIMNYALSRGYHNNVDFKKREFAKPTEKVDAIFLDEKELLAIFNLELSNGMAQSRDLFLIGAYTGLRVSDFNNLTEKNIIEVDGSTYVQLMQKKTKELITIPCNSYVIKILDKYDGRPPGKKSDQNINRDLKIIGSKAGINEKINITKTIGGTSIVQTFFKYDLITTHTARRSFCTNAFRAGIPTFDIMSISGHKTEKVFYNYIRATNLDKAKSISKHPFFK